MEIETDLKMSSCGGRGRDKIEPEAVPRRTSVAGGVMASVFPPSLDPAGSTEMGDQATVAIA